MNVLVVGCGRLGRRLAEMLDQNGDDVAVIDSDPLNFLQLSDAFSGLTVTGVPMDMKVLQSAGIESCDAVAVVTPDDNLNITVSQIAREFFHVENVVARISDPARENVFKSFGLRSVCHTKMAGDAIFASLTQPWEAKYLTFGTSSMAFHSRRVEPDQVGLDAGLGGQAPHAVAGLVLAQHAHQRDMAAQRGDVACHVGRAAQAVLAARDAHHRHRRLGGYTLHLAEPVAVQHDIAHHEHAAMRNGFGGKLAHSSSSRRRGA